ncbi:MAG: UDP-N-acetylglucosamine 2-epimerase (hydrolyzing) [Prochlorococcus marinus CUG1438]|nr:UDP-N-acetylglucosamine 2-epimerase (hydrolyzing) [Prochlorococcus marinus CUG1438]
MVNKRKKICVVTGTRAEYGLLRWIIRGIHESKDLDLILIVTGSHLSPEFGLTVNEIKSDGYLISDKVEMLLSSDTPTAISKSIGLGLIGFADKFECHKPDLLVLLGDRYEIYSAAIAAMISRTPIAHIHGGESTEGVIDEAIRHSITKMSHFHFVAAKDYKRRVLQLGENPQFVFEVGGLGIDSINKMKLLSKEKLEQNLGVKFWDKNLLVTFHPVTLEQNTSEAQIEQILKAIEKFKDINFIFTMPNADTNGRIIIKSIKEFCKSNRNSIYFKSLGQLRYLSCLKIVDGVIGNSSSGLIEVPSFFKGTINIGDRQKGRLKASSIIDCKPDEKDLIKSIIKLYSKEFQYSLKKTINPYGNGSASNKILEIIEEFDLDKDLNSILKKKFHDIH